MDFSVVAAVGSFFMSERVLKPKATVLVLLGCVLTYDLTTKTHDVASLRVYRGPALLAFTLMMVAFSLRTWRRNGVACDELLFLPGTSYAESQRSSNEVPSAEGDLAGGSAWNLDSAEPILEMTNQVTSTSRHRPRSLSRDSSLSSIREFAKSWDDEENAPENDQERVPLSVNEQDIRRTGSNVTVARSPGGSNEIVHPPDAVDRFRENHPRITGLGSFFFFRNSTTSTQSAAYAPSGPSVVGAALDLSMPILFNFHLFIEAFNHYDNHGGPETPAKILPLIFLSVLLVRTTIPPGRRGRFWGTMMFIFMAPLHASQFRDSYLGDVVTSLVRPLQDVMFALAYYVTVVYGSLSGDYGLSDSGRILGSSRVLHNVVLPSCSLLPLWWKFLQTLRECYDTEKRWPHLGNAFKYLSAALVIMYGMTHPEERWGPQWIFAFIVAVLYQIWWDTIMDWELFVVVPRQEEHLAESTCFTRISSVRPNSYILLNLQRYIIQPTRDIIWLALSYIPSWKQIQLRPQRLYKDEAFYWRIFAYNCVFRAAWMLCFIPSYHLDGRSFSADTHTYVGVLLPVIEILRRTFWGFLLLEVKTIQMTNSTAAYNSVECREDADVSVDSDDNSKHGARQFLPSWLGNQQQLHHDAATISSRVNMKDLFDFDEATRHKLFLAELSTWALAFIGLGLWVTT
ncbi:hypothetical protein FisN_12Lh282 [Fistulifera solaris]|uniref:EXS domain-containing protein n=1 Tax=Fistulifera solaris TaxID=1519565 RepID=A0A1Z5JMD3_FISSO|nr:hypothetical protein FisN_12Lh282 [Fistulifera solaris]|eukprot:GAX15022.1 hypothetical protein FisN_12Lh282 [Fistulifera solaris]